MNGRLDLRKNFFSVRSSSKWNMVPPEIKWTMPIAHPPRNSPGLLALVSE